MQLVFLGAVSLYPKSCCTLYPAVTGRGEGGTQKENENGQGGGGQAYMDVIFLDDIKLSFATTGMA